MSNSNESSWTERVDAKRVGRMLMLYGLVGVFAGLAAAGFSWLIDAAGDAFIGVATGTDFNARATNAPAFTLTWPTGWRWLILVLPALGGLASGFLCSYWAPEAIGTGTNQSIDAYHNHDGMVRKRVPFIKAIASMLTLGTGGSGGVEGPVAQISGGIGSVLSEQLGLGARERRVLMMAGFAAGIGAVFHAPMAAAIFAAEVLYSEMDIEHEVLVPGIIASTVAYGVYGAIRGWEPILMLPEVGFESGLQLLPYLGLAIVLAVAAVMFVTLFRFLREKLGRSTRIPMWLRPAIGGLVVGLIGLWIPSALGAGYDIVAVALQGETAIVLLVVLAMAKMITTSLTAGSGGAGGMFAPSLVIGAALGGAVGMGAEHLWPGLNINPAAFVVVGMAGFFAAVIKAPLSTVIMVAEVVGDYELIVPALWVCTLSWLLTRRWVLYPEQIPTRYDAPSALSDMMGAVLHRITVGETLGPNAPPPVSVSPDMPLRDLVYQFGHTEQSVFPIISRDRNRLLGVVDGQELRRTIGEKGLDNFLIANDFQVPAQTVTQNDTLYDAIMRMTATGYDELVVVDGEDAGIVRGIVSRRNVVNAYHRRMLAHAPGTNDGPAPADKEVVESSEPTENLEDLPQAMERGGLVVGIKASSPAQVLNQIIARASLPEDCDRGRLLGLLLEREELGGTGVGDGIAVPHPHTDDLGDILRPKVIIAPLNKPVDWGAYDGKPVDTVCVLLCPSGHTHLALLGDLARSLTNPTVRKLLTKRASLKQIVDQVRKVLSAK